MRIELIIHGRLAQSWDVPDLDDPTLTWYQRAEYAIALQQEWTDRIRKEFAYLFEEMPNSVVIAFVYGSRVNTVEEEIIQS